MTVIVTKPQFNVRDELNSSKVQSTAPGGPTFLAYCANGVAISNQTGTVINYDTKVFDTHNRFNNTASTVNGIPPYAFMPNVPGFYSIAASCDYESSSGAFRILFNIAGSGIPALRYADQSSNATYTPVSGTVSGSSVLYMNGTTDYVQAYAYIAVTAGGTPRITGGAYVTWFNCAFIRGV